MIPPVWPLGNFRLGAHRAVDVGGPQPRLGRHDFGLLAAQEPRHVHGVRADVHGGAARKRVLVANVGELREGEAQRGLDPADRSELVALHDLLHADRERVVAVMECLHHDEARTGRDRSDGFGFFRVGGKWLLAQHMLAGFECRDRPLRVEAVGERVVDGVDVGVGDERLVRIADLRHAVLRCERVGTIAIPSGHRADESLVDVVRGLDHRAGRDARRAEYPDPNRVHRAHCKVAAPRAAMR